MKAVFQKSLGLAASVALSLVLSARAEPGDLDITFNHTGKVITDIQHFSDTPIGVAVQGNGKIVVLGTFSDLDDVWALALLRYNSSGALDTTFRGTGKLIVQPAPGFPLAMAVQPNGKIVVATEASDTAGDRFILLLRYNANGTVDSTFNSAVVGQAPLGNGWIADMAFQPDGKIVLAGAYHTSRSSAALWRFMPNGAIDTTFNSTGMVVSNFGFNSAHFNSVTVQADWRIVASGASGTTNLQFTVARYLTSGTPDQILNGTGFVRTQFTARGSVAFDAVVQPDGKIVAVGNYGDVVDWGRRFVVVRYTGLGQLDTGFNGTGIVVPLDTPGEGRRVALLEDGKLLAGGWTGGTTIACLKPDGHLDPSFNGTGVMSDNSAPVIGMTDMVVQSDGKIVVLDLLGLADPDNPYDTADLALARYEGLTGSGSFRFASSVYVANESARNAVITVERTGSYRGTIAVNYATADGTGVAGEDYTATSGTLVFGPGVKRQAFRVPLMRDEVVDGGEIIELALNDGIDTLDTAVLILRERSLALSPRKLRPGQRMTLLGKFDPAEPVYVRFCDYLANDITVVASDVTPRSAKVRVPVFLDPTTFHPGDATVAVEAVQDDVVAGPVPRVPVASPSETGLTPGTFTVEFIKAVRESCALAEQDWQAIDTQSEGAVDSTELRTILAGMQGRLQELQDALQAVVDGTSAHFELGMIGSEAIRLDSTGLEMLDRMLVAAVFDGKYNPATAGFARLRALAEYDSRAALAARDPLADFSDELRPQQQSKCSGVFALARKVQEMAKTAIGSAAATGENFLGQQGVFLFEYKLGFAASNFLATLTRPALLGYTAVADAEPFIRNERRRPVTPADLDGPVEALHRGLVEGIRADNQRLARLGDLLGAADRQGTFLWDWVTQAYHVFDVPPQAQTVLDGKDINSIIAKAGMVAETIHLNRPKPKVSIESVVEVTEPASGSRNASFLVTLDRVPDMPVSVFFTVENGSAIAGVNFRRPSSPITIPAGSLGKWINVAVINDQHDSGADKVFFVELTEAINAELGSTFATGRIHDSVRAWTISGSATVTNYGTHALAADFTLPRTGGTRSYSIEGATAKVAVTASKVTVVISGFESNADVTVSGRAEGSAPIVAGATTVSASGSIAGNVHVIYKDGSGEEDLPVNGNFTATGTK